MSALQRQESRGNQDATLRFAFERDDVDRICETQRDELIPSSLLKFRLC